MITHITSERTWQKARKEGIYKSKSLTTEGFIHCSTIEQLVDVANYLFKGQKGLLVLAINEEKVEPEVRFEDLYGSGKLYPHIYGALNIDAVEGVFEFNPGPDGLFTIPPELKERRKK